MPPSIVLHAAAPLVLSRGRSCYMRRPVTASDHLSIIYKRLCCSAIFTRATFDELVGRSGIELVVHLLGFQLHYLLMIISYQLSAQKGIRGSCAAIHL